MAPPPAPAVSGISAPSWTVRLETSQTDRGSEPGNRYTFGWLKSLRPSSTRGWEDESVVEFSEYPDEFVMIEAKRFESGYPGRVTNFHLVGTDGAGGGISPLSADFHGGVSSDATSDIQRGLVLTCEPELIEQRRGIWQLLTESEINADRGAVWTLVWRIRWRQDRSGYAKVSVFKNGSFVRRVDTGSIRTAYADQQPRVYAWLGGYESSGLSSPAQIGQTLDYRGRSLDAALADRPSLGSTMTSVSSGGGADSSISGGSSFTLPVDAIRSSG